jgi:TPR repeat protein
MKRIAVLPLVVTVVLLGCAGNIQKRYWEAGNSAAFDAERQGDLSRAEQELLGALARAENQLGTEEVSSSLYNLGSFYRRQGRIPEAIQYFKRSLALEEQLSGPASVKTGRRLAELVIAYNMDSDWPNGKALAERLKPMAPLYSGSERATVDAIIAEYSKDDSAYENEIAALAPRAQQGDAEAQHDLAAYYEDGRGVAQDCQKALELYESSAAQGYTYAQYYLGVMYDKGRCVATDLVRARDWYRKAAEMGLDLAQYNYGICLFYGLGGPQDQAEALRWIRQAANQGYPPANGFLKSL